MNISIIVGGRFHAFNLADQLNKNNNLKQLITSYPKFFVNKNYKIPKDKIQSIIIKEIVQRSFFNNLFNLDDFLIKYFDYKASKLIDFNNLDILVGWSGFSLTSFKKSINKKCVKILERGSTHIDFQTEILKEEYKINNLKPRLPSKYIIEKEKEEYEIADYITVPTEFAKHTFLSKGFDKNKIIKIPYGVDLNEFKLNLSTNNKTQSDKFRIIYTGTVSIRKGIIYLLKAFNDLNLKNSELLIIGNIDNELIPKIKKYFLNKKIIFKKPVRQFELSKYYSISNIFVTCSLEEGLSMVQLQAMACFLPIICTKNSGGEEIVDHNVNGYIVPTRDINILKKKILFLYNNPSVCKEMGIEAEKKVRNNFSWEIYGKNVIQTYQKILLKK